MRSKFLTYHGESDEHVDEAVARRARRNEILAKDASDWLAKHDSPKRKRMRDKADRKATRAAQKERVMASKKPATTDPTESIPEYDGDDTPWD